MKLQEPQMSTFSSESYSWACHERLATQISADKNLFQLI